MNEQRKTTIINEIKYWKKSKLLPDQYCDYLLTLYTEGEHDIEPEPEQKRSLHLRFQPSRTLLICIMVQALFLLALLVIYFTEFPLGLQISTGIFFTIAIILLANRTKRQTLALSYLYLLEAAVLLFLLTIHAVVTMFAGETLYIALATFIHCLAWFMIGWKWKLRFFTIASLLGGLLLLYFIFR
ncbi:hypothetical protein M3202_02020 [Alkalihalobacillus oceani]|uniref:DUF2157 domain-containing protein n=1 Tax=Halalkalibacter oceani TaxID=1653776 RepID=A0A9X2DM75_9BACI|nr:hypothetical protein [Halalkalibacter oceani]MCM3712848.1 hypothetical protein [Halalkalibacter oceani]